MTSKPNLPRAKMRTVTVAIDVDGTLRSNKVPYEHGDTSDVVRNEWICTLAYILSRFKNIELIAWSGGGCAYAAETVNELGILSYFDRIMSKQDAVDEGFNPDIAIDDINDTDLGTFNLIVHEKGEWKGIKK